MPIQRSREHGARKAARVISRNFARLNRRQDHQQHELDDICKSTIDLCDSTIALARHVDDHQERIDRIERNLDNAVDTVSDEIDRISSRTVGLMVALVIFAALLAAALVIVWSKLNG